MLAAGRRCGEAGTAFGLAVSLLALFRLLLIDDFTPGYETGDRARVAIDQHPELTSAEVLTTPQTSAIVATRVRAAA
jgi:hypothetical protein